MRAARAERGFVIVVKLTERSRCIGSAGGGDRLSRLLWARLWRCRRLRNTRRVPVINHVQNFYCLENFSRATKMIRVWMRGDEIVELLHVVTLQRFDDGLAFRCVA